MANPWIFSDAVATLDGRGGVVTLVDESTFTISGANGDIVAGGAQGLFVLDMRVLSRFELRLDGRPVEELSAVRHDPFSATFVSRGTPAPGLADSALLIFRSRYVGMGMREDLHIRNYGPEPTVCRVEFFVDADFADLFAVKEGRITDRDGAVTRSSDANTLNLEYRRGGRTRGVQLRFSGSGEGATLEVADDLAAFEVVVPAEGSWDACVEVVPVVETSLVVPRYRCGEPVERAMPSQRLAHWRQRVPQVLTDHDDLREVVTRSSEDLGALRIFDPDFPERVVVAAGAPWFMTVFGRDSILTAWMALLVDPDLALGVLQTLARFQGTEVNPARDEEPGRILHEMRFGSSSAPLSLGSGSIYYGTVDATPLFVMLLGELRRWGLAPGLVDELLPNAERALAWITDYGDRDGDGYVEYLRATDRGLANQGWKDSWDGIRYADGRVATAPIALCEVQAYVYGAYLARAHFAFENGDEAVYRLYRERARALKEAFNRDFWLEDRQWFAVGLDGDKKPIDSLASNMGHCLWTGIIDEDKAAAVADRLLGPELFSGWGVRTLAAGSAGYNPVSYHCGSVWPHDTAIIASGLARYGFDDHAQRLVMSLIEAAAAQDGRLPELFSGLGRDEFSRPVGYPTSCSPQAWAAASPLLCLRTLLRFDPWVPYGKTWLAPMVPPEIGRLRIEGIPLAGARVDIEIDHGDVEVTGMPEGIELIERPRHPATAVVDRAGTTSDTPGGP
ncbi:MAG TPA: glycogen debranching N-terminal domain-containing protein [Acidimicrobiales bacterium]|nr:glycogen debranching N-terminal domain-containing protein [Acidimicrobiales bacterium]